MGSECQTMDMNWIGATLLLLFVFQDIVFAKHFLVETGDEEAAPSEEIDRYDDYYMSNGGPSHTGTSGGHPMLEGREKEEKWKRRKDPRDSGLGQKKNTTDSISDISAPFQISGKFESLAK